MNYHNTYIHIYYYYYYYYCYYILLLYNYYILLLLSLLFLLLSYIYIMGVVQNYGTPKLHLRRPARSLPGKS